MQQPAEKKERSRGGRPPGDTRERILDIALELFNDQGYDKTSLREIADRLGVTKAALYYHFARKEDILLELHLRLHTLGRQAFEQLGELDDADALAAAWPTLLDQFIESVTRNQALFLLHQRNRSAFERIADDERHRAENDDIEQRFRRVLSNPAIPLAERVRVACAIGAVLVTLMGASSMFGDAKPSEIADLVRVVVRDLAPPPALSPAGGA